MLFMRRNESKLGSLEYGDEESAWEGQTFRGKTGRHWVWLIGMTQSAILVVAYGISMFLLQSHQSGLSRLLGCFLESIFGKRECDQAVVDEYATTNLIFLSGLFIALIIFPVLLVVGTIKENRWFLLPWLIANGIALFVKAMYACFTLFNIIFNFQTDIDHVTLLAILFLDSCVTIFCLKVVQNFFVNFQKRKTAIKLLDDSGDDDDNDELVLFSI